MENQKTIRVHVQLFGMLREHLPKEKRGKVTVELPAGAAVQSILDHFKFKRQVTVAVNDEVEAEHDHLLRDQDEVAIFSVIGGG
jgi:molybdopterin converting factor small subunit